MNILKSLPSMLLVLFIGLKLTGYTDWSWWWVMAPFWIPIALVLVLAMVAGLLMMATGLSKGE